VQIQFANTKHWSTKVYCGFVKGHEI